MKSIILSSISVLCVEGVFRRLPDISMLLHQLADGCRLLFVEALGIVRFTP